MKRDSAVFYKSWKIAIDRLGDGKRGEIYEMILDYAIDSIYPKTDDPVALMIFDLVRVQIDVNNQRYANGKKGGRPKDNETENQTKTKQKPNKNQTKTKQKPNVNENVNENVNVIESNARARTRESQMQMFDRLITGRAVSHDMADALREWIEYKDERNERYKEAGMRSLITQAVNQGAAYGSTAVINVIRTSMASGYKGIVWDRCKRIAGQFNNYPDRNYDMDSLEIKLLATN